MTKILVISQNSPYSGASLKEALDMALIFAAVDAEVAWLFRGPALYALQGAQQPQVLGLKDQFKTMKTLEIYDVEQLYVCAESLLHYGLAEEQLALPVTALTSKQQAELIQQFDKVVTF
ncbi:sulfurtransferase complex subunit TusC [Pseudoalteromonas fenneropenaei]|uniref:Sulfurtransferase complex subunit TusC n=1 Tax=Pseudoalteromonas fenneropenaei TaxID=1737459 RepID=A0ABV7CHP8_9GAMM